MRVVDNLHAGRRANLAAVAADVEFVEGDCADPRIAERAARGMEVVYHEAAVPSVARSVEDPASSHRNSATATLTMLVAARDAGVRRFVYAGSSSVYGDAAGPAQARGHDAAPAVAVRGGQAGGRAVRADLLVALRHGDGDPALLQRLRPAPGRELAVQRRDQPVHHRRCWRDARPSIYGDGKQSRDFTYVANVVDGNLRALTAKGLKGQAVNLATGRRVTLNALLKALARELGVDARRGAQARRAPGDIRHSLADVRLARRLLGYRPDGRLRDRPAADPRLVPRDGRRSARARPLRAGARAKPAGAAGLPSSSGTRDS